jgi:transcriptional regulator with XRE-family HTH domain
MSTPLGKELRKLRIDLGITLGDMAQAIEKSASFLSAVETGRKRAPDDFLDVLASKFSYIKNNIHFYEALVNHSRKEIQLPENLSVADTQLATALARKFQAMTENEKNHLQSFLEKIGDNNG